MYDDVRFESKKAKMLIDEIRLTRNKQIKANSSNVIISI